MDLGGQDPAEDFGPAGGQPGQNMDMSQFLQETVGATLSNYGWYILFGSIVVYVAVQKLFENFRRIQTSTRKTEEDPDKIVRRQEAVAAARLRMQEDLNAQAERYREKQKQLEEEKRRQKIENWENMKEGKSYKLASRVSQTSTPTPSTSASSASSSTPKPKPEKKSLRGAGYNPLTGDGGGTCAWRPGRRGPSSGG
ncbi:selenoprotein S [Discoglossus pictus]